MKRPVLKSQSIDEGRPFGKAPPPLGDSTLESWPYADAWFFGLVNAQIRSTITVVLTVF